MVSDKEHVEALRQRLLIRKQEKEAELRELVEMIAVLGNAPRVLEGGKMPVIRDEGPPVAVAKGGKQNLDLKPKVLGYAAEQKVDVVIAVPQVIKTLMAERGVTGKPRSLYAYIHSLLKEESRKRDGIVGYKKGVGFYRKKRTGPDQDTLLATA